MAAFSIATAADLSAPDSAALTFGYTNHAISGGQATSTVNTYGVALNWNFWQRGTPLAGGSLDAHLAADLAYWQGNQQSTPNSSLWDVSLTPVLRWTGPGETSTRFFAEGGVGAHILSATRINNDRVFSTAFQFGEQAGAGVAFGSERRYELEFYLQHVSNANIKKPNDGLTSLGVVLRASLR